jgi:hypothetical protein
VSAPRNFDDYDVKIQDADLPAGVTLLNVQ